MQFSPEFILTLILNPARRSIERVVAGALAQQYNNALVEIPLGNIQQFDNLKRSLYTKDVLPNLKFYIQLTCVVSAFEILGCERCERAF